jgi:hypothetical protein
MMTASGYNVPHRARSMAPSRHIRPGARLSIALRRRRFQKEPN